MKSGFTHPKPHFYALKSGFTHSKPHFYELIQERKVRIIEEDGDFAAFDPFKKKRYGYIECFDGNSH